MEAADILKSWPGLTRAGAETVFASPAWRLAMRSDGITVTHGAALAEDPLVLDVTLDDEPAQLALVDSPAFPDLHLLWSRRRELPEALLLALVEKECGALFTLVEGLTRRLFALKGFSASTEELHPLMARGENVSFNFGLTFSPALLAEFGRLENLDPTHAAIRALTRPARAVEGLLLLTDDELVSLQSGDAVILPEEFGRAAKWETCEALEASDAISIVVPGESDLTFASFVDGNYPPIPETKEFELTRNGKTLFTATRTTVGRATALKIL